MHNDNWDDLRFVLAVAEAGTVSGAARTLGVNHATVLRRIAAFEGRHGAPVFQRTQQGYVIRPDMLQVIEAAQEAGAAMRRVNRLINGVDAPLSGHVRVTSTDTFCVKVLPPILAEISARQNALRVSLLSSNEHLEISRYKAEVAVRPTLQLPDDLVGERVATLGFAVYGAPGAPDRWLGLGGALRRSGAGAWLSERTDGSDEFHVVADSFLALREIAAAGAGRAVLPCCLGDPDGRLNRVDTFGVCISVGIWVASHIELAQVPRISAVRQMLGEGLAERSAFLSGE